MKIVILLVTIALFIVSILLRFVRKKRNESVALTIGIYLTAIISFMWGLMLLLFYTHTKAVTVVLAVFLFFLGVNLGYSVCIPRE